MPLFGSDGAGHFPDEGPEAQSGFGLVKLVELCEDTVHLGVVYHREHRRCQRGPRVGAVVRVAGFGAAPLHFAEGREAPAGVGVENGYDALMVRQVVCDENCLHGYLVLGI